MKNDNKEKSTGQSDSHKEVKVLLTVVVGVLIILIGGSAFLNFRDKDDARLEAVEEALLNSKSRMLREYDPILVNAVEIHDYEETHQGREYNHIALEIAMPNLQEVYDHYFEEMIKQEVWLREDPLSSIQDIYRQAVDRAEKSVYPLEEELLLKEEDGQWQVRNPEVLDLVLPHNPSEEIAKDFESVLGEMETLLEFPENNEDFVLQDAISTLLEEDYFSDISFDWHRDGDQNYRITVKFNEIMKMQEMNILEVFRHRREEIVDRQSLVKILIEEIRENTGNERDLRVFEIREVDQSSNDAWGYQLSSRGGNVRYYQNLMEDTIAFPQIARMNYQQLEVYYQTVQVSDEDPWPEALSAFDYENHQVVARYRTGEERRKLILEGEELWYRIYDPTNGEVLRETIINEEIQQEDVLGEDRNPYYRNAIKRREGYDLVVYGENEEHTYRVDWEPEPTATKLNTDFGDFHLKEIFYLADRPYYMGELGSGDDQELKMIQLRDIKKDQILIDKSYDQLSGDVETLQAEYFVSEAHDTLIMYYQGPEALVEELFPKNSLQIYRGTETGLEMDETLTEAFRDIGVIRNFTVMDRDRIFLVNLQNEQWILDLENREKISLEPGPYEQRVVDADHHFHFTPLSDSVFFAEHFFKSRNSVVEEAVFRREIWTVNEEVTRKIVFPEEESGYSLTYALEDQVFVAMKDNQELFILEPDINALENLSGENHNVTIEKLREHEAFTLLDHYKNVNEGLELGQIMILGQSYFYSPNYRFYSPENDHPFNPYRYDRDTGNLFYLNGIPSMRVIQRESDQPILPLWDYQALSIDRDFTTLYYRDHEGARIYDVKAFLESLKTVSANEN